MNTRNVITGAVLMLGLVACGQNGQNPVQATAQQTQAQLAVSGNWDSACSQAGLFGNFKSQKEEYHFGDDGSFEKKYFFYSDPNCQTASFVRLEDGQVSFQGTSPVQNGTPVNFQFQKVSLVPDSQGAADELNTLKYCGVNNYAVGQASDITANSSNSLCIGVTHAPRTTYDSIKLNDAMHINLGDDAKQEDPGKRPANVDPQLSFTKQ
jgi:hypothetical protein